MRSLKLLSVAVAAGSLLALGACKKDEDKTGGDKGGTASTSDVGNLDMDAKKAMGEKVVQMFVDVGKAMVDNQDDCAKMAAAVGKIGNDNKDLIARTRKIQTDAEYKKWFQQTHADTVKKVMTEAVNAMMKNCAEDEGVKKAFEALTNNNKGNK